MVIWGIITWWYVDGWRQCLQRIEARFDSTLDYFSFNLLIKTLFSPFRQISAGNVRGPIDVQIRAFLDRLISRVVGGVVRLIMILVGGIVLLINMLLALILLVGWAVVPLLPFIGLCLFVLGWMPWSK